MEAAATLTSWGENLILNSTESSILMVSMSEKDMDDSSLVWTTNWLRFLRAEIKVAARACHLAGISTRTLWVLAFELTLTLTSSDGPGDKLMGKLTKNKWVDVWLHIDMCTKGPDVLDKIINSVYPPSPWGAGINAVGHTFQSVASPDVKVEMTWLVETMGSVWVATQADSSFLPLGLWGMCEVDCVKRECHLAWGCRLLVPDKWQLQIIASVSICKECQQCSHNCLHLPFELVFIYLASATEKVAHTQSWVKLKF